MLIYLQWASSLATSVVAGPPSPACDQSDGWTAEACALQCVDSKRGLELTADRPEFGFPSVCGSVVEWLGRRTHVSRSRVRLGRHCLVIISETGDRLWRVNCLGNCNHHLGQLSLASLRGR